MICTFWVSYNTISWIVFQDFQLEITFPPENQENPIIKLKDTDFQIQSKDLYNNLKNCHKVYLLACTLGPQVDSLIRKTQFTDQVMASVFQATGAMYIEEVVDFANNQIAQIEKNQNKLKEYIEKKNLTLEVNGDDLVLDLKDISSVNLHFEF